MDNDDADWGSDLLYGSEPSAAPTTETLVADDDERRSAPVDEAVGLDSVGAPAAGDDPPDVNAGAKKTAIVLGGALLCAAVLIAAALVTFGDTAAPPTRPAPLTAVSATPVPTPSALQAEQDQAVPYTASANCPAGSTSAQALTDTSSDSAWVCVRGAAGATVDGQVLHVDLGHSYVIAAITVTPGWVAKTPGGIDEWLQHRVVTRVQYVFNDTDRTIFTQDTGNTHGPVTTPLPHKVLASRVTVVILQTARPSASPLPSATEPTAPGFGDSVLGSDGAPPLADATASAEADPFGQSADPVDATFAMAALTFLGHEPN
ncbi:hypothetical protein [Mycolicibacterium moriokaense]|uniref:F5/8 type C domain-containing protein n=1 Tax=Mycolicibacterium moriokaense TaxID=39691 RepID=A0A318HHQ7_9MYCO|nr:hypothetical protein [Mycolicibacterium moriokaense]PXX06381.1 hypothetical protein C8E89_114154 [Mycolicibacterium moriokaense]